MNGKRSLLSPMRYIIIYNFTFILSRKNSILNIYNCVLRSSIKLWMRLSGDKTSHAQSKCSTATRRVKRYRFIPWKVFRIGGVTNSRVIYALCDPWMTVAIICCCVFSRDDSMAPLRIRDASCRQSFMNVRASQCTISSNVSRETWMREAG